MGYAKSIVLKLPDQLLVRYFRAAEIEAVASVTVKGTRIVVVLKLESGTRTDQWTDLGGGLGYVPDPG